MSSSPEILLRRIEEMESQIAFQDEVVESLNSIVARQDREIRDLQRQFNEVSRRLKDIGDLAGGSQEQHEVPPHY